RYVGADIDGEAIAWCRAHLPFGEWVENRPDPPLPLPDASVELTLGLSVLAQLDEAMGLAWLGELRRVTAPGGAVILSVNGVAAAEATLHAAERAAFEAQGFAHVVGHTGPRKTDGLPDFCQRSYHHPDYVARVWSRFFRVAAHLPCGMTEEQDAVILVRPHEGWAPVRAPRASPP
ncbi:MAG TPA: hypothetical protein VD970_13910, partial [Acetobacteraceae bacterium]|nr:hypothetical protein [Acetobacteraceae bacterium]